MAKTLLVVCALVVLAMAHIIIELAHAINCIDVDMALRQCVPYLTGQAAEPTVACCARVGHLKEIATTTADKQAACSCMAASHILGIKDSSVSALPEKCNASLPYPISASVDCSKIQ